MKLCIRLLLAWQKLNRFVEHISSPFKVRKARPLWSSVAEARGAKVYQLNYASYMLPELKQPFKDRLHLHASEWSYVLPLNEIAASYLENKLPKKHLFLEGPL